MSPISTSEPAPPAPPEPSALPAPAPAATASPLLRGFLGDVLVASAGLVAGSIVLILPLVLIHAAIDMMRDGGEPDLAAVIAAIESQILAASVAATVLAGALAWWFRTRRLPSLAPMPAARAYPLALAAGLAIQGAGLLLMLAAQAAGSPVAPSNLDPVQEMASRSPWLAWLTVVVIAPLGEELLFRHVLLRRFAVAGRAVLGIVVTSLLFAAMHEVMPGTPTWPAWLAAVALYMMMGAGFGAVYLRTGRLGAAVVAHATCNLAAMTLAAFSLL